MKIWLASRQIGKSFALSLEAVREATQSSGLNLLLASSERQSRELMVKVCSHLRCLGELAAVQTLTKRQTMEEVTLSNGSRIMALPANPDTVRGFSGNVFLDEFAYHNDSEAIWRAMYPTITRGYKVAITSTPNGKLNMFHELWDKNTEFSRHNVSIHDAVEQGLDADITKLRAGIGDPTAWAQEFECRFIDGATAFLTFELIASCEDSQATQEMNSSNRGSEFYLGYDIGRKHDLSVIWVLEREGDVLWTRMVREMRGASFSLQRDTLYSLIEMLGARHCAIDSTGLGAQLAEEAVSRYGHRVEAVTFTQSSKEDMAYALRRHLEDRLLRIPDTVEIRQDLHSVRRGVSASGSTKFEASHSSSGHADRFWALALALRAADRNVAKDVAYSSLGRRSMSAGKRGF